jgi:shikimate kinase
MPLILFGHQFCGKSFLGNYLAKKFQRLWIDTDLEIIKIHHLLYHEKNTCREIYMKYGEIYFRKIESLVIKQIPFQDHPVISLGGGSLCDSESKTFLEKHGVLLWVVCSKNVLKQRTLHNIPPYLKHGDFEDAFEKRFQDRERLFHALKAPKIFLPST